ncbi:hypothetical protein BJ912DRAFT_936049 [Pholiota molesta]|nr:hypothetical protein BJ912DRAFT_936049 [Pholiota molesta]
MATHEYPPVGLLVGILTGRPTRGSGSPVPTSTSGSGFYFLGWRVLAGRQGYGDPPRVLLKGTMGVLAFLTRPDMGRGDVGRPTNAMKHANDAPPHGLRDMPQTTRHDAIDATRALEPGGWRLSSPTISDADDGDADRPWQHRRRRQRGWRMDDDGRTAMIRMATMRMNEADGDDAYCDDADGDDTDGRGRGWRGMWTMGDVDSDSIQRWWSTTMRDMQHDSGRATRRRTHNTMA